MDGIWNSEEDDTQNLNRNLEHISSSSSKRKTKGDGTTSGKKSRRTMSFGGVRIKPDSLQLSVVGYDDNENNDLEESKRNRNTDSSTSHQVNINNDKLT